VYSIETQTNSVFDIPNDVISGSGELTLVSTPKRNNFTKGNKIIHSESPSCFSQEANQTP